MRTLWGLHDDFRRHLEGTQRILKEQSEINQRERELQTSSYCQSLKYFILFINNQSWNLIFQNFSLVAEIGGYSGLLIGFSVMDLPVVLKSSMDLLKRESSFSESTCGIFDSLWYWLFLMLLTRVQSCSSWCVTVEIILKVMLLEGSWEEPHDLNGLWPWRLWPLKLRL